MRRAYSRRLKSAEAEFVWQMALALQASLRRGTPQRAGLRWVSYELVASHQPTFESLDKMRLEELGAGVQSWDEVDAFARTLSGPAWLRGLIEDPTIHAWARSPDLWWRRAALVSTVALNMRSQGGYGDTDRTLAVCELLAGDAERMVQQGLSWALRELVIHDAPAVAAFLTTHETEVSARTRREVHNKLSLGLKTPRRSRSVEL
jgi:3-methyladenine DNA glycosylase AlkD